MIDDYYDFFSECDGHHIQLNWSSSDLVELSYDEFHVICGWGGINLHRQRQKLPPLLIFSFMHL